MDRRTAVIAAVAAIALVLVGVVIGGVATFLFSSPTVSSAPAGLSLDEVDHEVVATDLETPWEVVPLGDDRYLVTERSGALLLIEDGERHVLRRFDEVEDAFYGEGGLLGIDVHPDFEDNGYLYVYLTMDREEVENTVRRFEVDMGDRTLENETVIIDGIPSARIHNGGRIAFGPDGHLYVTAGDANEAILAQDRDSLAGKILRLTEDGSIPADNPFDSAVYSYGHRNPQGIAWDDEGQLWATEHGPSAQDELNRIEPGQNYGWPEITGTDTDPEMESPVFHSWVYETWAPAGLAAHDGSLYFGGLAGQRLYEVRIVDGRVTSYAGHFAGDLGRVRAVSVGPADEYLYITTSNTDGRGDPQSNDDRIVRVPLEEFRTG